MRGMAQHQHGNDDYNDLVDNNDDKGRFTLTQFLGWVGQWVGEVPSVSDLTSINTEANASKDKQYNAV